MSQTKEINASEQERTALPLIVGLGILAILFRIFPTHHPFNMTPVGAVALFAGARFRSWLALLFPLAVMGISDVILWIKFDWMPFNPWAYSSFILIVLLGRYLRRTESPWKIGLTCVSGSLLFYLITNFGVWLGSTIPAETIASSKGYMLEYQTTNYEYPLIKYANNVEGLLTCYAMGLPFVRMAPEALGVAPPFGFFGNLFIGDLFFVALIFGLQAVLWRQWGHRLQPVKVSNE